MHTPGPWINCHTHVDDSRGLPLVVAAVKDFDRINCADFALIAAAPALLEALEELVAEWDAGNIGRIRKIEGGRMRDDSVGIAWAREAIAAARGEGVKA